MTTTIIKKSLFDVRHYNYIGTPSGILYSDKELKDITIFDLVTEVDKDKDYPILHLYKYNYKVKSSNKSLYINDLYLGNYVKEQYFEPLNKKEIEEW